MTKHMLIRHDDNGHTVLVAEGLSASDAESRRAELASRAHKRWFEVVGYETSQRDRVIAERGVMV